MDFNEIKKKHPAILFRLTNDAPELASILKQSYELYPREYFLQVSRNTLMYLIKHQ